jgi:hypothetical protein
MVKRSISNAFTEVLSDGSVPRGAAVASPLATLECRLAKAPFGWQLELAPFRVFDAVPIWATLSPARVSWNVVIDIDAEILDNLRNLEAMQIKGRLPFAVGESLSENHLALDDLQLMELVRAVPMQRLRMARVHGPVEPLDGRMMQRALDAGASPLDAELRAAAFVDIDRDRLLLHTREPSQAQAFVAENFRQYLAAVLDEPARALALPELWQVEQLLAVSGSIAVRPRETDVFAGFVDIGVCSDGAAQDRPAEMSIVFDRPSNSWHGEA